MATLGVAFWATLSLILCTQTSDNSAPVGQYPSIAYSPRDHSNKVLSIYNSAQGLETVLCDNEKCDSNTRQTLKCDAKLYSSALLSVNASSDAFVGCMRNIQIDGKSERPFHCKYLMVIGYGSLTATSTSSTASYVSFIICYDYSCSPDYIEEVVIDTFLGHNTPTLGDAVSNTFGYSISLSTYVDNRSGNRFPMFTYSKFSTDLKQFILNVIICLDFHCNTWIGKSQYSFASNPPYLPLGIKPAGDGSVGRGVVSIKETWSDSFNYVSILFTRNVNLTISNTSSSPNVYLPFLATCSLIASNGVKSCLQFEAIELNYTRLSTQSLKSNTISMVEYTTRATPSSTQTPLFIASYVVNDKSNTYNELWLLYCFTIFCRHSLKYPVRRATSIDFPVVSLSSVSKLPKLAFFENSSALMVMSCNNGRVTWNCTAQSYNHPTQSILFDASFETSSMQIAVINNGEVDRQSVMVLSRVMNKGGSGGGIFNGSVFINCQDATCKQNLGVIALPTAIDHNQFASSFDLTVFVIMSWIIVLITIFGTLTVYKCMNPTQFISRNIMNAYTNTVALDAARIRPLSYWFFFANLICSAMCVVPWFAFFDINETKTYMVSPFAPVLITLLLIVLLHVFPLTKRGTSVLIVVALLYFMSMILLAYSFSFVWNVHSVNCETSDLGGLKVVICCGYVATCAVVLYLLLWNLRCFQALRLASPEVLRNGSVYYFANDEARKQNIFYAVINERKKRKKAARAPSSAT